MARIAVTTEVLRHRAGPYVDRMRAAGHEIFYPEQVALLTEPEVIAALAGCQAVIAGSEPYTESVFAHLPDLKIVARNGVGYDRVDVPAATRHGVAVTITPQGNYQAVAEHALALLLAVARSLVPSALETRSGVWRRRTLFIPLRGRTLGIVGLGRIGRSVAVRAAAFGCRVLACESSPDHDFARQHGIEIVDLDTLLAQSDFVTLHTPMNDGTRAVINRQSLARMKPGSILINTARGGLVDEAALHEALQTGHLAGAGLDVLCEEPPPADHPLLSLPNVLVTPHVASLDAQAVEDMGRSAAESVLSVLAGHWPGAAEWLNPRLATLASDTPPRKQ